MALFKDGDEDEEEQKEAINAFLEETTDQPLESFVASLLTKAGEHREAKRRHEKELKAKALLDSQEKEREVIAALRNEAEKAQADGDLQQQQQKKRELTREERKERERLLASYGYEGADGIRETADGELEIVYREGGTKTASGLPIEENRNAKMVQEKEVAKRAQQKDDHAKKVSREKQLLEADKLKKEKAKERTQKREKVRGPG